MGQDMYESGYGTVLLWPVLMQDARMEEHHHLVPAAAEGSCCSSSMAAYIVCMQKHQPQRTLAGMRM